MTITRPSALTDHLSSFHGSLVGARVRHNVGHQHGTIVDVDRRHQQACCTWDSHPAQYVWVDARSLTLVVETGPCDTCGWDTDLDETGRCADCQDAWSKLPPLNV